MENVPLEEDMFATTEEKRTMAVRETTKKSATEIVPSSIPTADALAAAAGASEAATATKNSPAAEKH